MESINSPKRTSYYKQINNIKYDRDLLAAALMTMALHRNLEIDYNGMYEIWVKASDGGKVTDCERETLKYIMNNYECTPSAKIFLNQKLDN
jgi:hypothetical protein